MKINVLVVDDRQEMRDFVAWLLAEEQAEVVAVGDGLEAVAQLCQGKQRFDLIISDVEMPRLDGWGLLAWIHDWHYPVPVVLMSGQASSVFVRSAREHGARGVLPKPFLSSNLHELLEALFDATGRLRPGDFYCPRHAVAA